MSEIKSILKGIGETIKVLLAEQPAPVAPQPEAQPAQNFAGYMLQDGTPIEVESLEPGKVVMINGAPAPAGEHILSDGTKIELDEMGVITEVSAPEVEDVPAPEAAPVAQAAPQFDAQARFAEVETAFSAQISELKSAVDQQNQVINQLFEAVKQMADLPVAQAPVQPAQTFESAEDKRAGLVNFLKKNNSVNK